MILNKSIALFLLLSGSFAFGGDHAHDHSHHNWKGDKKAFKSVKPYQGHLPEMASFKSAADPVIKIDQAFFKEKLVELSKDGSRCSDKELKQTNAFLKKEYEKLGLETKVQIGKYGRKKSIRNFIAVKKGKAADPKLLILSSHTDSVCNAGANDNGTGTIAALAIAKEIAQMELAHTVMFVGFDLEEKGLVGSKHFVSKLSQRDKKRLIGNINLEMMGTNSKQDGVFHVIDCDRADSNFITDRVAANIQKNGINLQINEACTTRSDHASFWSAGLPAVVASENFFGGDGDRCYHAPCDVVDERLDFTYMANIAKAMAYTVLDLAN